MWDYSHLPGRDEVCGYWSPTPCTGQSFGRAEDALLSQVLDLLSARGRSDGASSGGRGFTPAWRLPEALRARTYRDVQRWEAEPAL